MASGCLPSTEQNFEEIPLSDSQEKTPLVSLTSSGERNPQCPIINHVIEGESFPSKAALHERGQPNIFVDESLQGITLPHISYKDANFEKADSAADVLPIAGHVTTKSSNLNKRNALLAAIRNAGSQLESPNPDICIGQHSHEEKPGAPKPHALTLQPTSRNHDSLPTVIQDGDLGEDMAIQVKVADFSSVENPLSSELSIETENSTFSKTDESIMIDTVLSTLSQNRSADFSPNVTPSSLNKTSPPLESSSDKEQPLELNTVGAFDESRQIATIESRTVSERTNNSIPLIESLASAQCLDSTLAGATSESGGKNVIPLCSSLKVFNLEKNLNSQKFMKDYAALGIADEDQVCTILTRDSCSSNIPLSEQNHSFAPTAFVIQDDNGVKIPGDLSLESESSKHAIVMKKSVEAHASVITAGDGLMIEHACDGSTATGQNMDNRSDSGISAPSISLNAVLYALVGSALVRTTRLFLTYTYKLIFYFNLCGDFL